jgi:hypothetical protein
VGVLSSWLFQNIIFLSFMTRAPGCSVTDRAGHFPLANH